jgi:antitoxin FitA
MAQLLVRKVDDRIVLALKERAAKHGVSAEEEHRRILIETLEDEDSPGRGFIEHLLSMEGKVDDDLAVPVQQFPQPLFG